MDDLLVAAFEVGRGAAIALDRGEWKEEDHPRGQPGNAGQFGPGGGGGGEAKEKSGKSDSKPLGRGYSKEAKLVSGRVHTSNVLDATRALYEGRDVVLNQPRQVSTLIDHLGKVAKGFEKLGSKAPVFDLCKVSVEGTNLFCAETAGIPRVQMPQLKKGDEGKFVEYLRDRGHGVEETTELASHLRATQSQINGARAASIIKALRKDKKNLERPVAVSKDNYILDGHHFWAARLGYAAAEGDLTENTRMNVMRVDIDIISLLKEAEEFTGGRGKVGVGGEAGEYQPPKGLDPDKMEPKEVYLHLSRAEAAAKRIPDTSKIDTPERRALRKKIADDLYNKDIDKRKRGREATILLGLPASGKSSLAGPLVEDGALEVDPDLVKERLPEYQNGIGAFATHEESSAVTRDVMARALQAGDNIAWPRVDSPDKVVRDIKNLKALGYKVHVKHLEVSPDTAVHSAISRFFKTGRYVSPAVVAEYGNRPRESYEAVKKSGLADSTEMYEREYGAGVKKVSE